MFHLTKTHPRYPSYISTGIDWLGDIPEGWEVKKLKNSFSFEKGKNAGLYTQEYINTNENKGDYPVYSGQTENEGVMGCIKTFIYDEERAIFTTTVGAKVMTPMLLSGKFSLSQNCVLFKKTISNVDEGYFYYQLFPLFQRQKDDIPSHMQPSLRIGDLNKYVVAYPSFEEQQAIASYLDEKTALLDEAITKKRNQIDLLSEHRTALINNAITKGLDQSVEMKESGVEWIGEIPKGWEVKKLKYIADITLGKMLQEKSGEDRFLKPYLRAQNITWITPDTQDVKEMYFSKNELVRLRLKKGDLLVSEGGEVGRTCIWQDEVEECYIQNSVNCVRVKDAHSKFLLYHFFVYGKKGVFDAMVNRVSIAHLTREKLKEVSVVTPPLEDQQKIADYLDKETKYIHDMTVKLEQSIELLQEYKTSLISHAVSGKIKVL